MPPEIHCPNPACRSTNVRFSKKHARYDCEDCNLVFVLPEPNAPLRLFLSYGHDANVELVELIKMHLRARGHDVWFDKDRIRGGDDWRRAITEGIAGSQRFISFLSKHSTRDPGVCLDEIAIAIGVRGGNISTILVEGEENVRPPPSISHIQWLDMHDWRARRAEDEGAWRAWYQEKLAEIVRVVESAESRRFAGEIDALGRHLKPISSTARVSLLLRKGFVGRAWLDKAVDDWRASPSRTSRLFWLVGAPGVGKSAFAAQLSHFGRDRVIAVQFCEWDKPDHRNARRVVRSLAFQLATRLPDYRKYLLSLPEIGSLDTKEPAELFDYLIAHPLGTVIQGGRERYLIVIDAVDEAGDEGRNALVEMLARDAHRLPDWLGLVVTSRPESSVTAPLQGLRPVVLDAGTDENLRDVREYLRLELAAELAGRTNAQQLIDLILQKSEGVFLHVERFCEDVRRRHLSLDRPQEFPHGLGRIFLQYFQRQFPDEVRFRVQVRPALRAVLASREPLPVEVLGRLLDWRDEEIRDFTRPIASLFPVSDAAGQDVIRPYHKSLADWLSDATKAGPYFVSATEGHAMLAEKLLEEYRAGTADRFGLANLVYHLTAADRRDVVETLLLEYEWIAAKLGACGVEAVLEDYELLAPDRNHPIDLVRGAIRLSSHVLAKRPEELALQLLVRMLDFEEVEIRELLVTAKASIVPPALVPAWACLDAPGGPLIRTLVQHKFGKRHFLFIATNAGGRASCVSRSSDHSFKRWDIETGITLSSVEGHEGAITKMVATRDGRIGVSLTYDLIDVWDLAACCKVRSLPARPVSASQIGAIADDGKVAIQEAHYRKLLVVDLESGAVLHTLSGCGTPVAVSPDGRTLVSNGEDWTSGPVDATLKVWDATTGRLLRTLPRQKHHVHDLKIASDGMTAVSAEGNTLNVWNIVTGELLRTMKGHQDTVNAVAITADGKRAVSASQDRTLGVWDLATGKVVTTLVGHAGDVRAVSIAGDGKTVVSSWPMKRSRSGTSPDPLASAAKPPANGCSPW